MFPTKTSRDVGMVDGVSDATGSCMEKPTGENVQEQGGVFCDSVTTQSTFAAFQDTLWIHFHHPYIWQHLDVTLLSWPQHLLSEIMMLDDTYV